MQLLPFAPPAPGPAAGTAVGVVSADGSMTSTRPIEQGAAAPADAGLDALAGQAQQLKASAPGAAPGAPGAGPAAGPIAPPAPPPIPNDKAVAHLVCAVRDTVCMVASIEAPKRTLTDDKVDKLGEIWGGVLDHYGINLASKGGTYAPILVAVMASLPLVRDTVIETRKEIEAKDKGAARAATVDADKPSPTMTIRATAPTPAPAPSAGFQEGVIKPRFTP
jgi:hypothetical protein